MIASPGGLSSLLSTVNYTLYLAAYAQLKSATIRAKINEVIGKNSLPKLSVAPVGTAVAPPSLAILAGMIGNARTTLRLVGLLPIYAWMRQLLQGPKPGQDEILWATALAQCTLYGVFQLLENIAVLQDGGVLQKSVTARWNPSGDTARIKLWSYRSWFAGVLCDFVRLAREAQLERSKRARRSYAEAKSIEVREEDAKTDIKWWTELIVPIGWFPLALHCSLEAGLPNFNLGIMGMSGFTAGLSRTAALWAATA